MRRASDLFGLPVLDSEGGQVGIVREVLINLTQGHLVALIIPVKVLAEPGLIAIADPSIIGSEHVRLPCRKSVIHGEEAAELRRETLTLEWVRRLTVLTRSGNRLGNIEDIILDGHRIVALELSDGLIQDIFQGRDTIMLPEDISLEDDKVFVPDGTSFLPQDHGQEDAWRHDQGF